MEHSPTPEARAGSEKSLANRIAAVPDGAPVASPRVADWLADIADAPTAAALTQLQRERPPVNALIGRFAQDAPFLWDLVRADPARLLALLQADPDERFEDVLGRASRAADAIGDETNILAVLRRL